jgi:hypothetical protein
MVQCHVQYYILRLFIKESFKDKFSGKILVYVSNLKFMHIVLGYYSRFRFKVDI